MGLRGAPIGWLRVCGLYWLVFQRREIAAHLEEMVNPRRDRPSRVSRARDVRASGDRK